MIKAENISVEIQGRKLLEDVSLGITAGEIVAVVGQNGAGKSTLRKVLCGDLEPNAGAVSMDGETLAGWTLNARARVRAVLPQDSALSFPFTVLEVVLMGRAAHVKTTESATDYQIAREALSRVDALGLEERLYPTLSGGERQRVQFARVLAQIWEKFAGQNRYLLLDEPTANLDLTHQHQTLRIARQFAADGAGVLIILHDLNLAAQYADKVLILNRGRASVFDTPANVFTTDLIRENFEVEVSVIKHPFFDCPLIIWRDAAL